MCRNANDADQVNCCDNKFYSSRCPCFKGKLLCTSACKCINCGNSDGLDHQPEIFSTTEKEKRRKRTKHMEQELIRGEGWKFMKWENEQTISRLRTEQEHYVFLATVILFRKIGRNLSAKEILWFYDLIW